MNAAAKGDYCVYYNFAGDLPCLVRITSNQHHGKLSGEVLFSNLRNKPAMGGTIQMNPRTTFAMGEWERDWKSLTVHPATDAEKAHQRNLMDFYLRIVQSPDTTTDDQHLEIPE